MIFPPLSRSSSDNTPPSPELNPTFKFLAVSAITNLVAFDTAPKLRPEIIMGLLTLIGF